MVLRERGYGGLSMRDVAERAKVPLSQIHYHFRSKQGLIAALFEHQNEKLMDRQTQMYGDPSLPLSVQWERACDYFDEDIASGYVRVYMELWAGGWSDRATGDLIRKAANGWIGLLTDVARRVERRYGRFGPFTAEEVASLIAASFIGAEAFVLLGLEGKKAPIRKALRNFGKVIAQMERKKG
jgi:AcrR family transcriptional regulator